jgi:hypothetical protein
VDDPNGITLRSHLVNLIRENPKPSLSQDMVLLLRAGHAIPIEPAIFVDLTATGIWDQRPFLKLIQNHTFDSLYCETKSSRKRRTRMAGARLISTLTVWILANTRPNDTFATPLAFDWADPAPFAVYAAGRKLVAAPLLHSNPYVLWEPREARRRQIPEAAAGDVPATPFLQTRWWCVVGITADRRRSRRKPYRSRLLN